MASGLIDGERGEFPRDHEEAAKEMFCPSNVRNFVVLVTFAQFGMLDEVGRRSPSQADAFAQYLAGRFLASSTPEECLNRMERETGIEPATSSLGSWRSTAELLPLTGTTLEFRCAESRYARTNQSLALDADGNNL